MRTAERHSLGRRIGSLHRRIQLHLDRAFADQALGPDTLPFLTCVLGRDGVRQQALSEELCVDKATAARAVAKLERLGYVRRTRDPADARANLVRPTGRALAEKERIHRRLRALTDLLARGFTRDERAAAHALLARMEDNLASHTARTAPAPTARGAGNPHA